MFSKLLAGLIGAAVAVLALAVLRVPGGRPAMALAPAPHEPSFVEAALERPLGEIRFEGTPFERALAELSGRAGIPIEVEWSTFTALSAERDVSRQKPVHLRLRNAPLADVLTEVLDEVAGTANLGYTVDGGSIVVGTRNALAMKPLVRTYDVSRLLSGPPAEHGLPMLGLRPRADGASGEAWTSAAEQRAAELLRVIADTIHHRNWRDLDSEDRRLYIVGSRLVAVQTWENQRVIRGMLDQMHQPPPAHRRPGSGPDVQAWNAELNRFAPISPEAADAVLRRMMPEVELRNVTLAEAVEALRRQWQTDIVLRLDLLASQGVDELNGRFSLRLRNANLAAALAAAGMACPKPDTLSIGFGVERGVIVVAPGDHVARHATITRRYDVRDWLRRAMAEMEIARPSLPNGLSVEYDAHELYEHCRHDLAETIQKTVGLDSWGDDGGRRENAIRHVAGQLLITQTWENHEAIARLIEDLTAPPAPPPPAAMRQTTTTTLAASPARPTAEEALRRVIPEIRIEPMPIEQALQRLGEAADADLVLDRAGLARIEFDTSREVKLHLKGAALAEAMELLLRMAWSPGEVGYMPHEPAIVITSAEVAFNWPIVRVYDIADLTADDGPTAPVAPDPSGNGPSARQRRAEAVARFIEGGVDGWRDLKPYVLAGRMIVRGPYRNQRRVEALLAQLRAGRGGIGQPSTTRPTPWSATPPTLPPD